MKEVEAMGDTRRQVGGSVVAGAGRVEKGKESGGRHWEVKAEGRKGRGSWEDRLKQVQIRDGRQMKEAKKTGAVGGGLEAGVGREVRVWMEARLRLTRAG